VEQVCRILEVSRSGYYGWLGRGPSERRRRNEALRRRLVELHEKYPAMGPDSLYHLPKPEFHCSRKRVHRQMRIVGISSVRHKAYKATTNSNHSHPIAPNLLMRNFSFERPDQAWVGDITYIPTGEGWLYLAIVKDLCSRRWRLFTTTRARIPRWGGSLPRVSKKSCAFPLSNSLVGMRWVIPLFLLFSCPFLREGHTFHWPL